MAICLDTGLCNVQAKFSVLNLHCVDVVLSTKRRYVVIFTNAGV
jgi:hypothetical protein